MSKLDKLFLYSLIGAVVLTLIIVFMPTSIYDFYANPEIYDNGFNYYLWKFRAIDQDVVARVTGWVFFIAHFGSVGYLLNKSKTAERVDGYSKYNVYLLLVNAFFIVLHFVHTWVWYDALAQDTPVWSSQGSVIIMLVLILIIENRRRGLFFGKKVPLPKEATRAVMKYHGIYIALATIFTFWYHPMENTIFHIIGFFYMYLLFIQMSFSRTKIHQNKYFNVALEVTVLFHGASVAFFSGNAPWSMFLFGFAFIFFVTQIYGLGLNKKTIHIMQGIFVLIALLTYSGLFNDKTFIDLNEIIRIPTIEYLLVFVFVFVIYGWMKLPVHKIIKRVIAVILVSVTTVVTILIIYTSSSYQPDPSMYDYYDVPDYITVTESSNGTTFTHRSYEVNVILIPGGKVNPESYHFLALQISKLGYQVTVVDTPFNLAILRPNQASKFIESDKVNIVVGHSLGGVVASMVAKNNEEIDMLIVLGSYSLYDLDIPVKYIVGENENVIQNPGYIESLEYVSDLDVIELPGGNHAYFGFYGNQKGDNEADISNLDQQLLTIFTIETYILEYLN